MRQAEQPTSQAGSCSVKGRVVVAMFPTCSAGSYKSRIFLAAILPIVLAGCGKHDPDRCVFVPGELKSAIGKAGTIDFEQQSTNENVCLWRWATRLAPANGSIADVAEGAIGACEDAITMKALAYAQLQKKLDNMPAQPAADYEGEFRSARRKAMFYVAASRAGNCPIPHETPT